MSSTYNLRSSCLHILSTSFLHALHILCTSFLHAVTYCLRLFLMPFTFFLHLFHAPHILSTSFLHALHIFSTCFLHTLLILCTSFLRDLHKLSTSFLHALQILSTSFFKPFIYCIREPMEDEDPLLELLQTQSSFDTEQETGPDRPHQDTATRPRKPRNKWPKASDKTLWKQLDEDLDNNLEASLQGPVDRKLTTLTTLIYIVGKERFGLEEERVQKDTPSPNRRQTRIQNLRRELR